MKSLPMDKGIGIVKSFPSDSPDDYINLLMFKIDENVREKWGITQEMIFDAIHIIKLEGYSDFLQKI